MRVLKNWFLSKLTIDDIVTYFHKLGITIDLKLEKKQSYYYAENSRLYKRTFKESKG